MRYVFKEETTHVRIVHDRCYNPERDRDSAKDIDGGPPGNHKRGTNVSDLAPIKGEYSHSETRRNSKELVDDNVVCLGK